MQKRSKKSAWVKRTLLGRMACRLLGDNTGAVAMEYVVIALLVAAAVVSVVMYFGSTISGMFGDATIAIAGDPGKAADNRKEKLKNVEKDVDAALKTGKTIQTGKEDGADDTTQSSGE